MKNIKILGLALFAALALSATVAASAFATAEFLANGKVIASALAAVTEGEVLLEDMSATGGKVDVICDGKFLGTIGAGAKGEITEVEGLEGKKVTKANEATEFVKCKLGTEKGACTGTEVEVRPKNLNWIITLVLLVFTRKADLYASLISNASNNPGYSVICKTIIGNVTDTCTGNTGAESENGTSGEVKSSFIDGSGLEGELEITAAGSCTLGNSTSGLLTSIGAGKVTLTGGEALTVSE